MIDNRIFIEHLSILSVYRIGVFKEGKKVRKGYQEIIELINNHKNHNSNYIREWAENNFNININFRGLELVLNELNYNPIDSNIKNLIFYFIII